ncbi:diguanylate cyclase domain-containing protein [Egicoccus sp. AB-alg2]|uniref:diguanylate cyclase domain-containing protein n=1 Tax=Egicoccus sp. AB-alg2 TaxID=3242693 RepID=UPI00359E96D5
MWWQWLRGRRWPGGVVVFDQRGHVLLRLGREGIDGRGQDTLTGLPGRWAFEEALDRELHRIDRGGPPGCVAVLDLDEFKLFNDRYGHGAGDRLLSTVGARIATSLRTADQAARLGGDEFAVLMPATTAEEGAAAMRRLVAEIGALRVHGARPVTVSVGVAEVGSSRRGTTATVLGFADNALYYAKVHRRGGVVIARPGMMRELRAERDQLSAAARQDARTGLRNHASFEEDVARLHDQSRRAGHPYGLLMADIDHFHEYNRVHGQLAGHRALRKVGQTLTAALPGATVYRYGGEEFTALLPGARSPGDVDAAGARLVERIRDRALPHRGRPAPPEVITVTVAGVLVAPSQESTDDAVDRADRALIAGKAQGRDRYVAAPPD